MDLRTGIFFLWTFVLIGRPQDIFQSLQVLRPALVLGMLTLILIVLGPTRGAVAEAFQSPEGRKYVLLYLIMIVGIPFAYEKGMPVQEDNGWVTITLVRGLCGSF